MARRLTLDSGASDFVRREARDVYKRLREVRGAISQSGDPGLASLKRPVEDVSKVMKRWSEDGTKTADDMKQIYYTFHNKILPNITNLDSVLKNGTQIVQNLFRQIAGPTGIGSMMPNGVANTGGGIGGGGAATEEAGLGFGGLLGGIAGVGVGAALFAGFEGIRTTLDLARAQQEIEEQMAYRGTRMGRVGQFNALSRGIAGRGLMSYGDASQFALGVGNIGGVGNFGQFQQYTNEAAMFTRMLGLTNEQGMQATGELRRVGFNSNQLREFGEIIGKAAADQGLRGREGELLKALTDNLSQLSNFLLIPASASGAFGATAARFISGIEKQFPNTPGMNMGPGATTLMGAFNAIQSNNPFTAALGNISQPFIGLGLLNAAGGNLGKAMRLGMTANPGQPGSWKALASIINSMQSILGGANADPNSIQGDIQSQFALEIFGHPFTPKDIAKISSTIAANPKDTDAQLTKLLEKQGFTMKSDAMADLHTSLTHEINVLTNLTSAIGSAGFPLLTDAIRIFSSLAKEWLKVLPTITKGVDKVTNFTDDISKHGITPYIPGGWIGAGADALSGAVLGGMLAGPPGAAAGAVAGPALSIAASHELHDPKSYVNSFFKDLSALANKYAAILNTPIHPFNHPAPSSPPTGRKPIIPKRK